MDSRGQYENEPLNAAPNNSNHDEQRTAPTPFEESAPKVIDTSHLRRDALEKRHMAAYAVGHFSNDLCAAGWFFYLVFYLKYIVKLSAGQAGLAMLSGQFADGIMTPLVGALSDKIKTRIGSRTPWYILGTFIVIPSFLALFLHPFDPIIIQDQDGNFTPTGELIYYLIFPALFNVGWASV
jgi:Na+/melibiose symporter-like transporter